MAGGTKESKAKDGPTRHYHGHRERLRNRLIEGGGETLQDYELLELLLCAFLPRRDVKPIAKDLIARFGGVSGAMAAPVERLVEVDGVGETAAAYIRATHLLNQRAARETVQSRSVISSWASLLNYVRVSLQHETTEQFRVLFLDKKNQLIADEVLGRGTVDHAPVYPRELAKRALAHAASSVILVHNHPSGDPTPSRADVEITRDIIDALSSLEIKVHDHLIVGRDGAESFKAKGLI
ncbi:MAG: DNA repair protein RadC [Pseudomonadota bacterium]